MIKRILSLVLLFCIILSGCYFIWHKKKEDNIIIKYSTWGSASELAILKPIISEYELENPGIRIELIHIPQDYFQKLHLLFASNLAPDVVFINNLNLPVYSDYLLDLSNITDKNIFYPKALSALSYKEHIYAIPRDVSNLVIYYNKTLFKKYGINYPNENLNLDDLIKTAFLFKSNGVFGISYEPQIYYAQTYMMYFGGGILSDDFQDISDNQSSQKGINLYKNMAYKYHIAPTPAETGSKTLAQMFLEGKIAMHLSGRWLVPKYRSCAKFDWDIVNFPGYSIPCDASGWAVSKSSKYKEEAIKFIQYLSNEENIKKMTKSGLIVPARVDVSKSSEFLSGMPAHSYVFLRCVEKSKIIPISKDYTGLTDKINDNVFNSGD